MNTLPKELEDIIIDYKQQMEEYEEELKELFATILEQKALMERQVESSIALRKRLRIALRKRKINKILNIGICSTLICFSWTGFIIGIITANPAIIVLGGCGMLLNGNNLRKALRN